MRTRFVVAGLLGLAMMGLVQAQFGFGGRGGAGPLGLVNNKAVQEELKMSEEQISKLKDWARDFMKTSFEMMKEEGVTFGKGGFGKLDEEMQAKIAAAQAKITKEAYKQLADVLKPEQIKRLKQIEIQQLGVRAFSTPEVVEALKLTDSQKASVKGISGDLQKETREIFSELGGGFGKGKFDFEKFNEANKKVQKLTKEYMSKIDEILDESQKKTWKELTGEAFDLSKLQPGFGGFGGFGKQKKD
jgi:hypothetical protein